MASLIKVTVNEQQRVYSRKFRTFGNIVKVNFSYDASRVEYDVIEILDAIENIFEKLLTKFKNQCNKNDQIRVSIEHENLDNSIFLPFRPIEFMNTDLVLNEITRVSQSKREFLLAGNLTFDVIIVSPPRIAGRFLDMDTWLKKSSKVVRVNNDNLCLAKSIIISMSHINGLDKKDWTNLIRDTRKELTLKAEKLYESSGIVLQDRGVSMNSIEKIQNFLGNEYQIIALTPPKVILFKGPHSSRQIYIIINQEKNHANPCLSIKSFLKTSFFCKRCLIGFKNKTDHRCKHRCFYCYSEPKCELKNYKFCKLCNRNFASDKCYMNHIKTNICKLRKKCEKCSNIVNKVHKCGEKVCRTCRESVPISNHLCYITPNNLTKIKKQDSILKIFIFYDFETYITTETYGMAHRVNQACLNIVCDNCWESENPCSICLSEKKQFFGIDAIDRFCNYIFFQIDQKLINIHNQKYEFRIVAHNSKSFDLMFIIKYLLNNRIKPKIVRKGNKILTLTYKHFKFIDSLSFLPMALAKMPSCFGLNNDLMKGYFPYLMNIPIYWNYVGHYPSIDM